MMCSKPRRGPLYLRSRKERAVVAASCYNGLHGLVLLWARLLALGPVAFYLRCLIVDVSAMYVLHWWRLCYFVRGPMRVSNV